MLFHTRWIVAAALLVSTPAIAESPEAEYGVAPTLVAPDKSLLPVVHTAKAVGWSEGRAPVAAKGLTANAFARGLDHPRWLHVLPNGDVLVAESNKPAKEETPGVRNFFMKRVMKRAGAGVTSADRITLLRDADHDGVAELHTPFIENLYSPFGMALAGKYLYVANANGVVRFPYTEGITSITSEPELVVDLPAGRNHHWTKSLIASPNGSKLYATVGSNSNIAENGMKEEEGRAAIWEIDPQAKTKRLFATGLRNPNGLAWEPVTRALWTTVNERDELGNQLVPDYMTSVKDGGFYGWPYSYFGQHVDTRVEPQKPDLVAKAIAPDYALGAHTAALGLAFYEEDALPEKYHGGAFVGLHGSWNRKPRAGYKVVFVRFENGKPQGMPEDVLSGFVNDAGEAMGRPVGVAVDRQGALLVADDVGNIIWRVFAKAR